MTPSSHALLRWLLLVSVAWPIAAKSADPSPRPLPAEAIIVRGNSRHPCLSLTADELKAALAQVRESGWAKQAADEILRAAAPWLEGSEAEWRARRPAPGATFALGFAGCPICGGRTNLTIGANAAATCTWDAPGQIRCEQGHRLPDAAHPDHGTGYQASDGRRFYLVGQYHTWVVEQWSNVALPALAQAYLLTGDEHYADRGLLFLDLLASIYPESNTGPVDYPDTHPSGRLARPFYQAARALVPYADCYDWMGSSPAVDRPSVRPGLTRRQNIERNLLLDGAYYCYAHSWSGALDNGHADYLRGALAIGCLLDIPEYVEAAVNGPYSIRSMIANNLDRDGLYYESSPAYALHALSLYLTYANPLRNLRSQEYPHGIDLYADSRLARALTVPDLQLQLAGRPANFGDCAPQVGYVPPPVAPFSKVDYLFLEQLHSHAPSPAKKAEYAALLRLLARPEGIDGLRARYAASSWNHLLWQATALSPDDAFAPPPPQPRLSGSWLAGMKGLAVLRQGDQAALLRFGPTLTHGDPDELGLLYYANGYELSYDIGYGLGSTHAHIGWASSTVSHALVTVNESNQSYRRGSGGSLEGFASLPSVQWAAADSPLSYGTVPLQHYRRGIALVSSGYLVDRFEIEGGRQHDYGFGSLGTRLEPFGVTELTPVSGSLAPGFAWGERIGSDGNVSGVDPSPYWNAPPGNGYGFFHHVQRAKAGPGEWGGTWSVTGPDTQGQAGPSTFLRLHVLGDPAEPVFAQAPGLYPHYPSASYVLARRTPSDGKSVFLAVYEPFQSGPQLAGVERLGRNAVVARHRDGVVDVVLFGPYSGPSPFGAVEFEGEFGYLSGREGQLVKAETLGARRLAVGAGFARVGPGVIQAVVSTVDPEAVTVQLDRPVPEACTGQTAIFSSRTARRTSGYRITAATGDTLRLDAASLDLGLGRVRQREEPQILISDIPHEYSRSMQRPEATGYFDGKLLIGRQGGRANVVSISPGPPFRIRVAPGDTLQVGEIFDYRDLAPGDSVRIALPAIWTAR